MRSMQIFVQCIDDRHIFILDIEAKDVSIAADSFRVDGFRNDRNSLLYCPAKPDLCRSPGIFGPQNTHYIIIKICTSCQRSISLYLNTESLAVFNQFSRVKQRMALDLVYSRNNPGYLTKLFQMPDIKITDADT